MEKEKDVVTILILETAFSIPTVDIGNETRRSVHSYPYLTLTGLLRTLYSATLNLVIGVSPPAFRLVLQRAE